MTTPQTNQGTAPQVGGGFTPGPWCVVIGKRISVAPVRGGQVVAVCNYDNGPIEKANARLIAAAPELLEAAIWIVKYADSEPDGGDRVEMHRANVERARAAIAKAEQP
jgi:hypothetical protein